MKFMERRKKKNWRAPERHLRWWKVWQGMTVYMCIVIFRALHIISVRFYPSLRFTSLLINPEIAVIAKSTTKYLYQVVPKCYQYNARYILYLCSVVLQCTWMLCCGVRCCMLHCTAHSHCNPYTLLHQTVCTPVDWTTSSKHTNEFPNPWGPGRAPWNAQRIIDRTYCGPSYMLGHTLSLYIPHSL